LYGRLGVDPEKGLSDTEALEKNKKLGDNALTAKKKTPWYLVLLHELVGFFALLLWFGGILSIVAYILNNEDPSNV